MLIPLDTGALWMTRHMSGELISKTDGELTLPPFPLLPADLPARFSSKQVVPFTLVYSGRPLCQRGLCRLECVGMRVLE